MPADYEELRRAAEALSCEKWRVCRLDARCVEDERGHVVADPVGDEHAHICERAAFIALANPSTILALLSDLAALRAGVGEAVSEAKFWRGMIEECADDPDGADGYETVYVPVGWWPRVDAGLRALDGREAT